MLDNAAYIAYIAIGSNGDSRDGDWADGIAGLVSVTSFLRGMHLFCIYRFIAMLVCSLISSFLRGKSLLLPLNENKKRSVNTDLFGKWWSI